MEMDLRARARLQGACPPVQEKPPRRFFFFFLLFMCERRVAFEWKMSVGIRDEAKDGFGAYVLESE